MIETFTQNSGTTINGSDMERLNGSEILGIEEVAFYNSIANGLDAIQRGPKKETLQNILNYSENYTVAK